jgi:CoA:oxalate CoA-transferase
LFNPSVALDVAEYAMSSVHSPPLAGIRVLDLTQVLSGPYCTQMLGDLGADVIRLEGPVSDVARTMPPYAVEDDSVYFLAINRNKRSVIVDLKTPAGAQIARRLVAASDIVVENFRPGVCERLGLSPTVLRSEKPDLIWCSITGFGQDGPYRDKPAYDLIIQALSGGMSITGARDGVSVRAGIPIGDISAGMYASSAILAALFRRANTGLGETIDISMLDCQAAMLSYQAAFYLHSGNVPGRQGREHDSIATYGTFTAGDGVEFVLAALSDRMWERICHVIGSDDLAKDSRFLTAGDRTRRRAILIPLLEQKFATRGADEWMSIFDREGVPVGVVNTVDRVVVDPQIVHRGMITELTSDDGRKVSVVGDPMKFSESRRNEATYPPAVGEHTSEVLKSVLKMTDAEIAALASAGVVGLRKAALKRDRVA